MYIDIRAYDMADAEPRPVKATKKGQATGSRTLGVHQVALCLSYFADRNLPRQRGRIYLGPFNQAAMTERPDTTIRTAMTTFATALGNLGGANVDWSLWSPTNNTHTRISTAWVDDSWDIIRRRKLPSTARSEVTLDG